MATKRLEGLRVVALTVDGFEQAELTMPKKTLEREGAELDVVLLRRGSIQEMNRLSS